MANPPPKTIDVLREEFRAHGQSHVFDFWDQLDDAGRAALHAQTSRLAPLLTDLVAAQGRAIASLAEPAACDIEPADAIVLPEYGGDPGRFEAARRIGLEVLAAGRVGVLVVAGGQATRLGRDDPKGGFPIGPVTDRSLFALQAQKIRGLARRLGGPVPWYVMTSPATDWATRALFERNRYFDLDPEDVFIFSQSMVPACDFDGRFMLETASRVFENPNGHGGALTALLASGALDDMARRGIDRLFCYQVDNPLVRIADPVYVGFHEETGAQMSCKVARKTDPMQKVGVVARSRGRPTIVEYTELSDAHRRMRDDSGDLVFWAGNVAIHLFDTDFVRRIATHANQLLPYHASVKEIPSVDASGRPIDVAKPNGYKLERFVFDALPAAEHICVLEVRADEEFAPIKNAVGTDSPETARRALVAQYRGWLLKAGIEVPRDAEWIEINHAHIDGADEAATCGFEALADAGDVIQVAMGMDS
ncbi:MAG: UDPGP type 1 family protein [Deltaproteobacteria bacterium]|nr:UDPGP type 1 family protein [Deltaproteobacteria bacterium]MBW2384308.1 UDPGP type 1 family protein [Deltaproteobacteria bacterium]MBW2697657.1 UDPGP type 1 family protein [Deltaproteobacteria bacterium]